jgi:uroporphyrin-III C-methyltransferase/precorrin-2 dehydrogenase/sirohydrochlorin ferrochelatase
MHRSNPAMARFRFFPVSYAVAGRRVLVAGNGETALQKLRLLVRSEARLILVAASPSPGLAEFAAAHGVERMASVGPKDVEGAALAFIATGEEGEDIRLAAVMRAGGVPVNVVDRPQLSDFATPSIVDRAPISIAIATDGHAPVLAVKLRGLIEALLPPTFGRLGELAAMVRARALDRLRDPLVRRRFWGSLFESRCAEMALAGDVNAAAELATALLDGAATARAPGRVFIVGTGPGAADLLTLRAHRLLLAADVVAADETISDDILAMARRDAERVGLNGRLPGETTALLAHLASEGKRVVCLVPGAAQLDAMQAEVAVLRNGGVDVEIVPGVGLALANHTASPSRKAA